MTSGSGSRIALATPAIALLTSALTLAACGGDDGAPAADAVTTTGPPRIVEVTMQDVLFEPSSLEVTAGESVQLMFTNEGALVHDAFIGDADEQAEHEAEMAAMASTTSTGGTAGDDMDEHEHGDGSAVTVRPGETSSLVHTFTESGTLEIGCHQPGHYAAGMKVEISVG